MRPLSQWLKPSTRCSTSQNGVSVFSRYQDLSELRGKKQRIHQNSDVVKQPGQIKAVLRFDGEAMAKCWLINAVPNAWRQKVTGAMPCLVPAKSWGRLTGINQIAYIADTQRDDCVADRGEYSTYVETARNSPSANIARPATCHRKSDSTTLSILIGLGVLSSEFGERAQHRRHRRQIMQFADFALRSSLVAVFIAFLPQARRESACQ